MSILPRRMSTHRLDIDPFEQPVQLLGGEFHDGLWPARPDETVFLQPFHQQPEAIAAPAEQLDAIPAPIAEGVERLTCSPRLVR